VRFENEVTARTVAPCGSGRAARPGPPRGRASGRNGYVTGATINVDGGSDFS
jgi:hypothetical protein